MEGSFESSTFVYALIRIHSIGKISTSKSQAQNCETFLSCHPHNIRSSKIITHTHTHARMYARTHTHTHTHRLTDRQTHTCMHAHNKNHTHAAHRCIYTLCNKLEVFAFLFPLRTNTITTRRVTNLC